MPSIIQEVALNVITRIEENRIDKEYFPKSETGEIFERYRLSDIDMSTGDWLILTRTKSLLKSVPTYLKKERFIFLIQHKAIVLVKVCMKIFNIGLHYKKNNNT